MGWGTGLGAAAEAGMSTYTSLSDQDRKDAALKLDQNQDKRAQTKADRETAADQANKDYYKSMAGAPAASTAAAAVPLPGQGGAPVVNPDPSSPANADKPVGVKAASPDVPGGSDAPPVSPIPASSGSSDAPRGIPTGNAAGSLTARAQAAFQANPTAPDAYKNLVAAKAADEESALNAARIRSADVSARAAEHRLTQDDVTFSQEQSSKAATRAVGALEGYGKFSGDVAASDPRVIDSTKRVLTELQNTHSQMADGQTASWQMTPAGAVVQFKDSKSGKLISTQTLGTVQDVRNAVQMTSMSVDPENYSKIIGLNMTTKAANEIQGTAIATAKSDAENKLKESQNKGEALDAIKVVNAAISDKSGVPLLDPKTATDAKTAAAKVALLYPDVAEYEKKTPRLDDKGVPEFDASGKVMYDTTRGNRFMDAIEYNTPKQTTQIRAKNGTMRTMTIDTAAQELVGQYPQILKDSNQDPNVAKAAIESSLLKQGFDARTVAWKMDSIMHAGAQQQVQGLAAAATPASVAVKQPGGIPPRNRAGGINPQAPIRNRAGGISLQ